MLGSVCAHYVGLKLLLLSIDVVDYSRVGIDVAITVTITMVLIATKAN